MKSEKYERAHRVQFAKVPQAEIRRAIIEYEALLENHAPELQIHKFLSEHIYFFNCISRHTVPIYSKVRLGAEYEADFAFYDPSSYGAEWNFIEIESPAQKMFTKAGRPSAKLTHAIEQARDWNRWLKANLSYARQQFPLVEFPFFYVFIGRRADLTADMRCRLRQINYDNRSWLEVGSLDRFADGADSARALGEQQLFAYTQAEMLRNEPKQSFDWLRSAYSRSYKKRRVSHLLNERDAGKPSDFPGD